jgi:hypothetical protein
VIQRRGLVCGTKLRGAGLCWQVKARDSLTKEQYTDTTAKQTTMNHFPGKPSNSQNQTCQRRGGEGGCSSWSQS